jgi:hypothetical protein
VNIRFAARAVGCVDGVVASPPGCVAMKDFHEVSYHVMVLGETFFRYRRSRRNCSNSEFRVAMSQKVFLTL